MKKYISKLHYLTQDHAPFTAVELAEMVCSAGAKYVQYRSKNKDKAVLLEEIRAISGITDDWGTTLIINDYVALATQADVQGVHLGKDDLPVNEARALLGDSYTIGGTANTIEDIIELTKNGADYIGLGPYKHTFTKENLSPILGLDGYKRIMAALKELNIDTPIIAIGGIELNDIESIMNTGVHGIAISSAVNMAENPAKAYEAFYDEMLKY